MPLLTPQQAAVVSWAASGQGNLLVTSRAGTGKTTTGVEAAKAADALGLTGIFYFNKPAATDTSKRLAKQGILDIDCSTTHSRAYHTWAHAIGKKSLSVPKTPNGKAWEILKELRVDLDAFPDALPAFRRAQSWGFVPKGLIGDPSPSSNEDFEEILFNEAIDFGSESAPIEVISRMLRHSVKLGWQGYTDFDDMLYLCAIYRRRALHSSGTPFHTVFVDEAQDLSRVQRLFFHAAAAERFCFIGDDRQSIYAFRGADCHSMNHLREEFSCSELKLTVSFRCPRTVISHAQTLVPDIEAASAAPEGVLDRTPVSAAMADLRTGDTVLSRTNAPLLKLAFSLIRKGIPAQVLGRDIGKSLLSTLKKAVPSGDLPLSEGLKLLSTYTNSQCNIARAKGAEARVDALLDRQESLFAIAESITKSDPICRDLIGQIESIFSDDISPILLSSIHKSKGREWDRVWILESPSFFKPRTAEQATQEENLRYVAITRAAKELRYLVLD